VKMFDVCKTGMIGLPYGEKNYDDMLSRFHTIPACYGRTDGRTDGRTELLAVFVYATHATQSIALRATLCVAFGWKPGFRYSSKCCVRS